jgi:hypothetical protein
MPVNSDFRDLFFALSAAEARYLVVGAYAVVHHSEPRYTKDLDVWTEATPENALKVLRALAAFGAPVASLRPADLCDPETVYQIGIEPNRVDVLTALPALEFGPAWERSVITTYGGVEIRVLGLDDLILTKRTLARPQDLLDVERLEATRKTRR